MTHIALLHRAARFADFTFFNPQTVGIMTEHGCEWFDIDWKAIFQKFILSFVASYVTLNRHYHTLAR